MCLKKPVHGCFVADIPFLQYKSASGDIFPDLFNIPPL
jgi:hypothetical protein